MSAAELSRLLFESREQIEMWSDVVESQSGKPSNYTRDLVVRIDNFRRDRGWSPDGFSGEVDPQGLGLVESVLSLLHYRGLIDSENNREDVKAALDVVRQHVETGYVALDVVKKRGDVVDRVIEIAHAAAPFHGSAMNQAYSVEERLALALTALAQWDTLVEEIES